jgi:serine/threonine protein kinase
MGAAIYTIIT